MNQKGIKSPIPSGLPRACVLAIRWVFAIEFDLDPRKMHPDAYKALLDLLAEQGKNPMDWTLQECDEFLTSLITDPPPAQKTGWAKMIEAYTPKPHFSTFQILPQ